MARLVITKKHQNNTMSVEMRLDYVLKMCHSGFNSLDNWEGLCGHFKGKVIFTLTFYNFWISTPIFET